MIVDKEPFLYPHTSGRKTGPARYGAPMGGLGGLAGLVAANAGKKKAPFRPPPGAY